MNYEQQYPFSLYEDLTPQHELFLSPLHASTASKESTPKNQETSLSIFSNYQPTTLNLSKPRMGGPVQIKFSLSY